MEAKKRYTLALLAQLPPLIKQIKEYTEEISRLLDKHPEKNIFRGLPRSGDTLSARLLGELGDNKTSYNVVKRPPIEKVVKEQQRSLSSLAIFCGGYPHRFMLPA